MTDKEIKEIKKDTDGLKTYEFLVNHADELTDEQLVTVVDSLADIDRSGQYLASGVRYLNGIDRHRFRSHIERMTALTIDRDREHKFISDLIINLYGADYYDRIEELKEDNNFRRMYKRLYPDGAL